MNETLKEMIMLCSGFEGFLRDKNKFLEFGLNTEIDAVLKSIVVLSEEISKKHIKENEIKKLIRQIKSGEITISVIRDFERQQNKKRRGKQSVLVNRGAIEDLGELIVWKMCDGCNYKKKKCKVRSTMLKLEMYAPCDAEKMEKI